ncbi:MAG: hypothetical protein IT371_08375 [Deltaproteobacteria bacterium]|nr:hypothetical protein [Deltaproteobacteria bacterium]
MSRQRVLRAPIVVCAALGLLAQGCVGEIRGGGQTGSGGSAMGPEDPVGVPLPKGLRGKANGTLPAQVDHASRLAPVRDQGSRGMSLAFATAAALEGYYGLKEHLSVEHVQQRIGILGGIAIDLRLRGARVAKETDWPIGGKAAAELDKRASWGVDEAISTGLDEAALKKYLADDAKNNIVVELAWDKTYEEDGTLANPKLGGLQATWQRMSCRVRSAQCEVHTVLLVGYKSAQMDSDGQARTFFKVRNSRGASWGEQGYGWVSAAYLTAMGHRGMLITKAPTPAAAAASATTPSSTAPTGPEPTEPEEPASGPSTGTGGGDKQAPQVKITKPAEGAVLQSAVVHVETDIKDNDAIVQVELRVNGEPEALRTEGPWNFIMPLPSGPHELTVVAQDKAGNRAQATVHIVVDAGDIEPGGPAPGGATPGGPAPGGTTPGLGTGAPLNPGNTTSKDPIPGGLGAICKTGKDCASKLCAEDPVIGQFCSETCVPTEDTCTNGLVCMPNDLDGGSHQCLPFFEMPSDGKGCRVGSGATGGASGLPAGLLLALAALALARRSRR